MDVRAAIVADADAIAATHVRSWQAAYRGQVPDDYLDCLSIERRAERWREMLGSELPDTGAFVLEGCGEVLGLVHVSPSRDADAPASTGELTAIYLTPESWGRGGGRLLLDVAMTSLRAAGFAGRPFGSLTAMRPPVASMSTPDGWLTAPSRGTTEVPSLSSSFGMRERCRGAID